MAESKKELKSELKTRTDRLASVDEMNQKLIALCEQQENELQVFYRTAEIMETAILAMAPALQSIINNCQDEAAIGIADEAMNAVCKVMDIDAFITLRNQARAEQAEQEKPETHSDSLIVDASGEIMNMH